VQARPTIGVDVGGTKCLGVAADAEGRVLAEHRLATPDDGAGLIESIAAVVHELGRAVGDVAGVGVGVPGLVDGTGALRFTPNLPGIRELSVGALLGERFGDVPLHVDNDATCAGWAEATLGAAAGKRHVLLATLGTGIGGGLVADGRLLRGANGFAGEIGHIVVDPSGPPCPCGQRGCWERFASGSALARFADEVIGEDQTSRMLELAGGRRADLRGEHVTRAAAEGDPIALGLMDRFGWWLALGLANLANILDPECIVIGGGLIESGGVILEPTRRAFHELVEGAEHRPDIPIVAAALGERAGAIGAALLARPTGASPM
jgi:glucokinase